MNDQLLVAPLAEPVHLIEAKAHLRVTSSSEDALIARAIRSARRHVETYCRRALVRQQRLLSMDRFPASIELPMGPLRAVQSIEYLDTAGVTQILAASEYRVDDASERARITPAWGKVWPSTLDVMNAVRLKYTVGHAVYISSIDLALDVLTAKGHDLVADSPVIVTNSGGAAPGGIDTGDTFYVKAPTADTLQLAAAAAGAAINITGMGSGASFIGAVPDDIVNAMLLLIEDLYAHRGEIVTGTVQHINRGAEALLSPHRLVRF